MNPLTEAYSLGYHSGVNGEDPRVCPFPKMTLDWTAWNEGQRRGAEMCREANRWVEREAENDAFRRANGQERTEK